MGEQRMPRARAVARMVVTWVMGGVLVVAAGVGIVAILVPAVTGATAYTVLSGSMQPSLPPGTLIVVRETRVTDLAPGDVITFQLRSGEPAVVTHRIVEVPELVRDVQVRGTLWYAVPWVGWLSRVVTGEARALVVPLVAAGLGTYAVWMFVSAARSRRRERAANAAQPAQAPTLQP